MSLLSMAACVPTTGSDTAQHTAAAGSSGGKPGAPSSPSEGVDPECTKATKVKIVEQATSTGDIYSFSPSKVSIARGAFLAVVNKSDAVHALIATPGAGLVTSVLDLRERQVIQFPAEGRFTVQSADAAHRAVLRVTVSGDSGCGTPKPTLVITAVPAGGFAFTPAKITLAATENFTVVNKSGVAQTVVCDPDPGGNGDNSTLDKGETQLLAIDGPGRYHCTSVQHRSAKVTVTVTGS